MKVVHGVRDPSLSALITERRALRYAEGADRTLDRPAHVRAGSSLAWVPGGLAVIQDDANFLALIDPATGSVRAITLPAGEGGARQFDDGRGNKKAKLDLEACVTLEVGGRPTLFAFGSGSTGRREKVLRVSGTDAPTASVDLIDADPFYDLLRAESDFARARLNLEGVIAVGAHFRFFDRGNGKERHGEVPVNATCDIVTADLLAHLRHPGEVPPPPPSRIRQYDLGDLDGVPLSFTDATLVGAEVIYSAAAEASPDAEEDGAVTGSAIGIIGADGAVRWTPIVETSGAVAAAKVEGIVATKERGRFLVVLDADDPDTASELCTVELRGY